MDSDSDDVVGGRCEARDRDSTTHKRRRIVSTSEPREYVMVLWPCGTQDAGSDSSPLHAHGWRQDYVSARLGGEPEDVVPCTLEPCGAPCVYESRPDALVATPLFWQPCAPTPAVRHASTGSAHDGVLWSVLRAQHDTDVCVEVPLTSVAATRCFRGTDTDTTAPPSTTTTTTTTTTPEVDDTAPPAPPDTPSVLHVCCHAQVLRAHSDVLGTLVDAVRGHTRRQDDDTRQRCPVSRTAAPTTAPLLQLGSGAVVPWHRDERHDHDVERWRPAAVYTALSVLYALSTPCGHVLVQQQGGSLPLWCATAAVLHEWNCGGAFLHVTQLCETLLRATAKHVSSDLPTRHHALQACVHALAVLTQPAFEHTALCERTWGALLAAPSSPAAPPPAAGRVAVALAATVSLAAYNTWCSHVRADTTTGALPVDRRHRGVMAAAVATWGSRHVVLYRHYWLGAVMWLYASGAGAAVVSEAERLTTARQQDDDDGGAGRTTAPAPTRHAELCRLLLWTLSSVPHPIDFVHVATTYLLHDIGVETSPVEMRPAGMGVPARTAVGVARPRWPPPLFAPLCTRDGLGGERVADALRVFAAQLTTQLIANGRHDWSLSHPSE